MTPSGTLIRPIRRPFWRRHIPVISPTGSGRLATWRTPATIFSTRLSSRANRSRNEVGCRSAFASVRSCALAERIATRLLHRTSAIAASARSLTSDDTTASVRAAGRAAIASSRTICAITSSRLQYHQVIPVNHLIEWFGAQRRLNLAALDPFDPRHLLGVIIGDTPGEFFALGVAQADHLAPLEPTGSRHDPRWQETLAPSDQRLPCSGIDGDLAPRLTRMCQPTLSTPHPRGRRLEQGSDFLAMEDPG